MPLRRGASVEDKLTSLVQVHLEDGNLLEVDARSLTDELQRQAHVALVPVF